MDVQLVNVINAILHMYSKTSTSIFFACLFGLTWRFSGSQGSVLEILTGLKGPYSVPGIEPILVACKKNFHYTSFLIPANYLFTSN